MQLKEACELTQRITQIDIQILEDEESMELFCHKAQLHASSTHMTASQLKDMLNEVRENEMLVLVDIFGIHAVFIQILGQWIALGPFCTDIYSQSDCTIVLRKFKVPQIKPEELAWYRGQFPVNRLGQVQHYARSLLRQMESTDAERIVKELRFMAEEAFPETETMNQLAVVKKRYEVEMRMMEYIRQGNANAAVDDWKILHKSVEFIKKIGNTVETSRVAAAITRTTIRLAGMEAGLPYDYLDQRTGESRKVIGATENPDVMEIEQEKLIRDICNAVNLMRTKKYSVSVLSAVYCMERRHQEKISIQEIAEEIGISTNYFITLFKKETNMTPGAYLENVRIEHAKRLLLETQYTIQQISDMVGIPDPNYFVKVFKKHCQTTPMKYRMNLRK